ncbi:MAG: sulfatase-like hydrolase/transferase [Verrucomicrobiota bacterium]
MKLFIPVIIALCIMIAPAFSEDAPAKPNVLFIAIDDLRDWVGYLGGHPQARTPNIDRLAARGVAFTRSYCASPSCNPSRASLMSGMRPGTTGVYNNSDDWRQFIDPELTLNMHFRANGYEVLGSGKIYHESFTSPESWDGYLEDEGVSPEVPPGRPDGIGGIKFAPLDCGDEDLPDWKIVDYAIERLGETRDKPLFLACGIHMPHMPWNVPRKYYDMHPLDQIVLPPHLAPGVDLADVPPPGIRMAAPRINHRRVVEAGQWKEAVQGYLAAISYTDMLIGRLLDALDQSPVKDNTIICLWSDHGWNLGEKEHWRKFALWEETTRSPLLWVVPGGTTAGTVSDRTVDLTSVYPTLCDLCGIETPNHVEGSSIRTLLEDPAAAWAMPALSTYTYNNHAVRDEGWRYIRYRNGEEELYNNAVDPNEWHNLAKDPAMTARKREMSRWIPTDNYIPPIRKTALEQPAGTRIVNLGSRRFGTVAVDRSSSLRFTVRNKSMERLENLRIMIDGEGAGNFKLLDFQAVPVLSPGAVVGFNIRFAPASHGEKRASLHVSYTGSERSPYRILLIGDAYQLSPEIVVSQPAERDLKDGKSRTLFGTTEAGGKGITKTFVIRNTGNADLEKILITLDGANADDYSIATTKQTSLSPRGRAEFSVKFKPAAAGIRKASLRIRSNDADETPFDIDLSGVGAAP